MLHDSAFPMDIAVPIPERPRAAAAAARPSLIGLTREELGPTLLEAGVPERQVRMRAAQLWHWLYLRGATDFSVMTSMSKALRDDLAARFSLARFAR